MIEFEHSSCAHKFNHGHKFFDQSVSASLAAGGTAAAPPIEGRASIHRPACLDAHDAAGGGPSSGTGDPIEHSLKRWPLLLRYADSGTFPIENNAVGNAINPIVIGKKNWLFVGSERAANALPPSPC
jgi:hypothetical protein